MDDMEIISLFRRGHSIEHIIKAQEAKKRPDGKAFTLRERREIVERVLYEDYMRWIRKGRQEVTACQDN